MPGGSPAPRPPGLRMCAGVGGRGSGASGCREKGPGGGSGQPHPQISLPPRRRSRLERRKHFLIPQATNHGRRAPAPRGCPAGATGTLAGGASPDSRIQEEPVLLRPPLAGLGLGPESRVGAQLPGSGVCRSPSSLLAVSLPLCEMEQAGARRSPRERTHHHGSDRLARDVGHGDPDPVPSTSKAPQRSWDPRGRARSA